jgi:hypothetical protein
MQSLLLSKRLLIDDRLAALTPAVNNSASSRSSVTTQGEDVALECGITGEAAEKAAALRVAQDTDRFLVSFSPQDSLDPKVRGLALSKRLLYRLTHATDLVVHPSMGLHVHDCPHRRPRRSSRFDQQCSSSVRCGGSWGLTGGCKSAFRSCAPTLSLTFSRL